MSQRLGYSEWNTKILVRYLLVLVYYCSVIFSSAKSSHFKRNPCIFLYFCTGFKLVMQIHHADQQKASWFAFDFCVKGASYIATLLSIDNETFFLFMLIWLYFNSTVALYGRQILPFFIQISKFTFNPKIIQKLFIFFFY